MPKIAEAARAARREQIIAAGLACFALSGYHATSQLRKALPSAVNAGAISADLAEPSGLSHGDAVFAQVDGGFPRVGV